MAMTLTNGPGINGDAVFGTLAKVGRRANG